MSSASILIIGAVVLACGCAGLLLVRLENPRLLGLGWLGAAMGTGGTGALLLVADVAHTQLLSILAADVLVLGALVLLHVAVMEAVGVRGVPSIAIFLLVLQAAADLFKIYTQDTAHFRITVIGFLIAAQASQTVLLLLRRAAPEIRYPARFISVVLIGFISWNVFRSVATASGLLAKWKLASQAQAFTYVLYFAVALGIAFGFFWMTTAGLTAKLEDLASTDSLTHVLNRRAFVGCLQQEFERSQRNSASFALVMLDLDHFKQINDRYGHITGDEVLCAAVQNIQNATRGIDVIGRWGGEEFAVLLPQADAAAAEIVAQRIRVNIQKSSPLADRLQHIPVTASLGVAVRGLNDSIEEILQRADAALYRAKSAGRNCVVNEAFKRMPGSVVQLPLALVEAGQA